MAISERFPIPVLKALMEAFPFQIDGFHADTGSEYINHRVAELLNKLRVGQFTKSRAPRSNDNALVESKNASYQRTTPPARPIHVWAGLGLGSFGEPA